jgi:hypothetical protein
MFDEDKLSFLEERFIPPAGNEEVYHDLMLPASTTLLGTNLIATIDWSSSQPQIITNLGEVTRPSYGLEDELVLLTYRLVFGDLLTQSKSIEYIVKALDAPSELEMVITNDFGFSTVLGYGAGKITYTPTGSSPITSNKDRVQITVNTNAPHTEMGAFALFAPVATKLDAYLNIDLSSFSEAKRISLEYSLWNQTVYNNLQDSFLSMTANLKIEKYDGAQWQQEGSVMNIKNKANAYQYQHASFVISGGGQYRIVYSISGTNLSTLNTSYALAIDNMKISNQ